MSRDSLLSDDWPMEWLPFSVEVRPNGQVVELIADGHLDSWTVGTLLRTLAAVYEPSFHEVHLDLRRVTGLDAGTKPALTRCQEFAASQGARFRVSSPVLSADRDTPLSSSP